MKALLKHTGIALAILVPLAAYSSISHASTGSAEMAATQTATQAPVTQPTSVDRVDLNKYAGQWYEIARMPMYFQRNCASDVTATYTLNTDNSGSIKSVDVLNQCKKTDGSNMTAKGLAKPANDTGSELKVSFLPSWLRWLPVGKADYWVLALDGKTADGMVIDQEQQGQQQGEYQSALVGTPDNKYLWILSRTPTLPEETISQYKAAAQQQGYDISQLKMTTHTSQSAQ